LAKLEPYEISEDQARRWAKDQLGNALSEIRESIDDKLDDWRQQLDEFNRTPMAEDTTVTPNTVSALFAFIRQLPGVVVGSLSSNELRVGEARDTMTDLHGRLKKAGIDLDERFTSFPDRLAELRKDVERKRAARKAPRQDPPSSNP